MKLFFLNTGDGYILRVHTLTQTPLNTHTHSHLCPVFGLKTTVLFHFSAPPWWRTLRHRWNMFVYDSLSSILLVFSLTILQLPLGHLCIINPKTALILMCITMTQPLEWKNNPSDAANCTAPQNPGNRILWRSHFCHHTVICTTIPPFIASIWNNVRSRPLAFLSMFSCYNLHTQLLKQ